MQRYIVFIANIKEANSVVVNCFLFEISKNGKQLPVKKGRIHELTQESPLRENEAVMNAVKAGAESLNKKDQVCEPTEENCTRDVSNGNTITKTTTSDTTTTTRSEAKLSSSNLLLKKNISTGGKTNKAKNKVWPETNQEVKQLEDRGQQESSGSDVDKNITEHNSKNGDSEQQEHIREAEQGNLTEHSFESEAEKQNNKESSEDQVMNFVEPENKIQKQEHKPEDRGQPQESRSDVEKKKTAHSLQGRDSEQRQEQKQSEQRSLTEQEDKIKTEKQNNKQSITEDQIMNFAEPGNKAKRQEETQDKHGQQQDSRSDVDKKNKEHSSKKRDSEQQQKQPEPEHEKQEPYNSTKHEDSKSEDNKPITKQPGPQNEGSDGKEVSKHTDEANTICPSRRTHSFCKIFNRCGSYTFETQ